MKCNYISVSVAHLNLKGHVSGFKMSLLIIGSISNYDGKQKDRSTTKLHNFTLKLTGSE